MFQAVKPWRRVVSLALICVFVSSCASNEPAHHSPRQPLSPVSPIETHTSKDDDLAISVPSSGEAKSEPTGASISFEATVRKALAWHPSIDEAVGRINQRTAEIGVARAGYYPKISAGINSSYSDDATADGWQPGLELNASQMIYDFGKVSNTVAARTAAVDVSRADLLLAVDELARNTADAVIEVQRYRAMRNAAQDQLASLQDIAALVQERTDTGASTQSDSVQADARVQAAQSTLLEITATLQRWQRTLADLIGSDDAVNVTADVPQWLLTSCDVPAPDWSRVPIIAQSEARREEALAQLKLSRAEAFPTVSLKGDAGYDLYQSSIDTDQPTFSIGLNVSGSLYDGGAASARRNAASHALGAADATIRNSRYEVGSALAQAHAQIGGLRQLVGTLSTRDNTMRKARDLYRRQYLDLGTRSLLDLLNAEQELHQAIFELVTTKHDIRKLGVQCMYSSGQTRKLLSLDGLTVRGVDL